VSFDWSREMHLTVVVITEEGRGVEELALWRIVFWVFPKLSFLLE